MNIHNSNQFIRSSYTYF